MSEFHEDSGEHPHDDFDHVDVVDKGIAMVPVAFMVSCQEEAKKLCGLIASIKAGHAFLEGKDEKTIFLPDLQAAIAKARNQALMEFEANRRPIPTYEEFTGTKIKRKGDEHDE